MSVRKVYEVMVDHEKVFSGSYAMAISVYESFMRYRDFFHEDDGVKLPDVCMVFRPDVK